MASTKDLSKELYLKGFNIEKIAEILNKSPKTIQNYKSRDGNWDEIKADEIIKVAKKTGGSIYSSFIEQMYLAIKEISEDEKLSSKDKAAALSKVGDSFAKMRRVAKLEDPASYKLSIAREIIRLIVERFQNLNNKEALKSLVEMLEDSEFLNAIENLE